MFFVKGEPPKESNLELRGGTPLVRYGEQYLGIAHQPQFKIDGRGHYFHHFVVFDRSLRHIETSSAFFLRRRGVEFACGLQLCEDFAYISYGVADRAAEILRIPVTALSNWLVNERY
jgi:hypothetical protein